MVGISGEDKAMIVVKVTIKGTSPILLNNPASMGSNITGKKVIPTPKQEAESKCYWDTGRTSLVIPSWNLFRCLVSASKGFRDGKKSLSPTFNSYAGQSYNDKAC
jgi:hypothetical protein